MIEDGIILHRVSCTVAAVRRECARGTVGEGGKVACADKSTEPPQDETSGGGGGD
jgi:hypothetical protein